jgi:PAS domain S-box-containing protein
MINPKLRHSITFKFLCIIAAVLTLSTIVLSTAIALKERSMFQHSLVSKGMSFASYIGQLSQDSLIMKDQIQLDAIVNEANKDGDILYTIVEDVHGNSASSQYASINYPSPAIQVILSQIPKDSDLKEIVAAIKKNEPVSEVSAPMITGSETIGHVVIGMSERKMRHEIVTTLIFVVSLNFAVALILGAVLFFASKRIILDPVTGLASATARLARGELSVRVASRAGGEMKQLIDSFNKMAQDLERTTVSKEYVDNIIRTMIDALLVISPDGVIVRCNAAACMLAGYEESELCGHPVTLILKGEVPDISGVEKGFVRTEEAVFLAKDGRRVPVLLSASLMHGADEAILATVLVALDITDRKRAEEELAEKALKLARSNTELEQFAYVASHDMQEPLRKIQAFGDRLEAKFGVVLNDQGRDYLMRMKNAAGRMQTLINDLLAFSRVTTKAQPFRAVELDSVVQGVLCDLETRIERSGGRVEVGKLPALDAEPVQMRQLMQNLIGNALKFRRAEEAPLVKVDSAPAEAGFCCLIVSDNGIGFEEKYLDRIFAPFQRLHGRNEFEGTGIGLALCKKIAELHGGSITAESRPGEGARFMVTLPLRQSAAQGGCYGEE